MSKKLLLTSVAVLFLATGTAWAQSGDPRSSAYGGANGFFGPGTGSVSPNRHPGYARAINISPRTGRPYDSTNYALPCWTKSQAAARLKVFGQRVPRLCK